MQWLSGRKTYIVAVLMVAAAGGMWWAGLIDSASAWQRVLEAAGLVGLRLGVAKTEV